jgi:hypothetical protein
MIPKIMPRFQSGHAKSPLSVGTCAPKHEYAVVSVTDNLNRVRPYRIASRLKLGVQLRAIFDRISAFRAIHHPFFEIL